ncbi:MAG TPA: hypothetical protein VMW16_10765 [Sedimentisphaerales bacterium]|nr:hypothetical protein [Sedimentisphaerales bacterium]
MNIIIVGRKGERRRVRWLAFLTLAITLLFLVGLGSGAIYFLLCGRWSHSAVLCGGSMGMGMFGLYSGLASPLEKLREPPSRHKIE